MSTSTPSSAPFATGSSPAGAGSEPSIGQLLGEVTRDLSTLMRQEVALAKAEAKESATQAGKGAGMFAAAGLAGHFVLLFLSLALWWALAGPLGESLGWSAVVVAVLWGIVAAVLALRGRTELSKTEGLPRTAETAQKIPHALHGHEEKNA